MKALTILQPWATPVSWGWKPVENRGWAPPASLIGQQLAIHAGKNVVDEGDLGEVVQRLRAMLLDSFTRRQLADDAGKVVAVVRVRSYVTQASDLTPEQKLWYVSGQIGWVLIDSMRLPVPVPVRGQQGLWTLPAGVEADVRRQLGLV